MVKRYIVVILLGMLSLPASATLLDAIADLNPGDTYRVIFATSTAHSPGAIEIAIYNTIVQSAATSGLVTGGLGISEWNIFGQTSGTDVFTNTGLVQGDTSVVFFFNTVGELLATSARGLLEESITANPGFDENGVLAPGEVGVWTGLGPGGPLSESNHALGDAFPIFGIAEDGGASIQAWYSCCATPILLAKSLYGLSAEQTVISVPEPGTLALFSLGLLGIGAARRRRKV